jgi:hypothetical protein
VSSVTMGVNRGECMDGEPRFPSWDAKRTELRRRLAAKPRRVTHHGPLRLAPGAYVEPDRLSARVSARQAFLHIAGDVEPELLISLAGAPLDEYAAAWDALGGPTEADPRSPSEPALMTLCIAFLGTLLDSAGPTGGWARRWGFPIEFTPSAQDRTGERTLLRSTAERSWGMGVAGYTLHRWRAEPLSPPDQLHLADPFAATGHFAGEDLGLGGGLTLPAPQWDPQGETHQAATVRIMGELRRAVRGELGRIEAEARARAMPPPAKRTGTEHLVWLARYQLPGESFATIARDVCKERQSVTGAVKATAALIGLPLRTPNPPGRARTTPRRAARSVRIAPRRS